MLGNARTAVKFLTYGLVIGLLFAPRPGKETRKEVLSWFSGSIQETVSSVTGAAKQAASDLTDQSAGETSA